MNYVVTALMAIKRRFVAYRTDENVSHLVRASTHADTEGVQSGTENTPHASGRTQQASSAQKGIEGLIEVVGAKRLTAPWVGNRPSGTGGGNVDQHRPPSPLPPWLGDNRSPPVSTAANRPSGSARRCRASLNRRLGDSAATTQGALSMNCPCGRGAYDRARAGANPPAPTYCVICDPTAYLDASVHPLTAGCVTGRAMARAGRRATKASVRQVPAQDSRGDSEVAGCA